MGFWCFGDVLDRLLNRFDLICLGVWDLNGEFFFDSHDHFYSIEAVKSKILRKCRCRGEFGSIHFFKALKDVDYPCADVFF